MDDFGLMFYNARMYDPALGRFTSADTVMPATAQGFDRYNYVDNRPTISVDPTGHWRVGDENMQDKPACAKKPKINSMMNMADFRNSGKSPIDTYTTASIGVQNPWNNRPNLPYGRSSGRGPAKISDEEMETPYGVHVNDGRVGLGLRVLGDPTPDQTDLTVAFTAMQTRIQVHLDACNLRGVACTPTDVFLGAALGGDAGFSPDDLRDLGRGIKDYGEPHPDTGIFQWKNYLDQAGNEDHNLDVIQDMVNNVAWLQDKGANVPDVDWTYVCSLLKK